jgi:hypothetical protein
MPRGRPLKSNVRQNIIEILHYKQKAHGYEVYKYYKELFKPVTMRNIYYHLKKGIDTGEFRIERIEKQAGDYSWGGEAERVYYALGEKAAPKEDARVRKYFEGKE